MEWINNPWYSWPFAIGAITVASIAIGWLWQHPIKKGFTAVKWIVRQSEIYDSLRDLAEHFEPNGGSSFYDQVARIGDQASENTRRLERLEEGQEEILNTLRVHVVQRQPGGKRKTDPT